mmetsp:Transcript_6730/g.11951  ORF Transcript_6730/g.11951 Transcript_6730/m.11951 type:complete len:82 (-) Transcript_6730:451-696(-)
MTRGDTERAPTARLGGLRKAGCLSGRETGASAVAPPVRRRVAVDAAAGEVAGAAAGVASIPPLGIDAGEGAGETRDETGVA